jgi:hypothetical protein
MNIYEAQYGFTILRILTELVMLFLAILFLVAIVKTFFNKLSLVKSYIIISILSFSLLSYVDIDRYIAKKNIEFYKAEGIIDTYYLVNNLSDSAILELVKLKDIPDNTLNLADGYSGELDPESNLSGLALTQKEFLINYLYDKKNEYKNYKVSIRNYNFTKSNIKNVLENLELPEIINR